MAVRMYHARCQTGRFMPETLALQRSTCQVPGQYVGGATWLVSPAFASPNKISPDPPVGALA